jgi:anti-sigma regulatory factor (Ser/Thr protein kinase)
VDAERIMTNSPTKNPQFAYADVTADPESATKLRKHLSTWLEDDVPEAHDRADAITLAVYEALANAVEHAYVHLAGPGAMNVSAVYHRHANLLSVTVQDHGRWQEVKATSAAGLRGRGIPLMQALSDHPRINPTAFGTTVILEWNLGREPQPDER